MSHQVIKCNHEDDLYVVWSSNVDAPVMIGSREDVKAFLVEEQTRAIVASVEERVARATLYGSSAQYPLGCVWDDEGLIYKQDGWLPRAALGTLARRLLDDEDASVEDLLQPFEGDREE